MADWRIETRGLTKHYRAGQGTVKALHEVFLDVGKAEFVAVQGPSGCGKTTLLLTIGGLLEPDGGRIEIGGVNPYQMTHNERAHFREERGSVRRNRPWFNQIGEKRRPKKR